MVQRTQYHEVAVPDVLAVLLGVVGVVLGEVDDLGREASGGVPVHCVAGPRELLCELEVAHLALGRRLNPLLERPEREGGCSQRQEQGAR